MWRAVVSLGLVVALPGSVSAGPISEAVEKAGRELALAQQQTDTRNRGRFWTGIGLLAGGGVLAALGGLEIGDDEDGPDDAEDFDESDDGEDSDGWGNAAMFGGGLAAATVGGVLLLTGRNSGPSVSLRPGRVAVRHVVRF
jgi:hypothetical protein